jgi:hypothetical protein
LPAAITKAPVWLRPSPAAAASLTAAVPANTPVAVLAQFGAWVQIEWAAPAGPQRGWIPLVWLTLNETIAPELMTPSPGG